MEENWGVSTCLACDFIPSEDGTFHHVTVQVKLFTASSKQLPVNHSTLKKRRFLKD
jgi:hypothetical protein